MATTHDIYVKVSLVSLLQNVGDLGTAESRTAITSETHLTTGTGADQSDQFYSDSGECAAATDVIDLAGALTNAFGESITLTKLKGLYIKAGSANTVDIEVTMPAGGAPFMKTAADALLLKPGMTFYFSVPTAAAIAISSGSTDLIHLTAAAGTATYDVALWGVE